MIHATSVNLGVEDGHREVADVFKVRLGGQRLRRLWLAAKGLLRGTLINELREEKH